MNLFKTKFDAATIVLIPACIGINYLGKMFASLLKLPLWLDSIGTCIGGCLGGPIIGGICGAANNLIYGLTAGDNITLIYALTSLGIGLAAGIMARLGFMKSFPKALITACVAGFVAVLISTPLNVICWGGTPAMSGAIWCSPPPRPPAFPPCWAPSWMRSSSMFPTRSSPSSLSTLSSRACPAN